MSLSPVIEMMLTLNRFSLAFHWSEISLQRALIGATAGGGHASNNNCLIDRLPATHCKLFWTSSIDSWDSWGKRKTPQWPTRKWWFFRCPLVRSRSNVYLKNRQIIILSPMRAWTCSPEPYTSSKISDCISLKCSNDRNIGRNISAVNVWWSMKEKSDARIGGLCLIKKDTNFCDGSQSAHFETFYQTQKNSKSSIFSFVESRRRIFKPSQMRR